MGASRTGTQGGHGIKGSGQSREEGLVPSTSDGANGRYSKGVHEQPPGPTRPQLTVSVIGTGRAGSVIGAALRHAGHAVVAATGTSEHSVERAAALLPGVPLTSVEQACRAADLIVISVPDDQLPGLVAAISDAGWVDGSHMIMHTSGRYGISVLGPATDRGALPLAIHPAMTLTGVPEDLGRLEGSRFGVTTIDSLRAVAEALVYDMGGEPLWIPEKSRPEYHAALAFAANYASTLVATAVDLLRARGIENPGPLLGPLVHASVDNALDRGDAALTGPVVRGDARTIQAHSQSLAELSPVAQSAYLSMARLTADRALAAGLLSPSSAEQLLSVLARDQGEEGTAT